MATFTGPTLVKAIAGQDTAYDGPFYAERSPINVISKVNVPTFLIGGEYDLFQRGTPLLYENLRKRGVPAKMILGPWDHLKGSSGAEVGNAGYGPLNELQLRWFDHYVKGKADPTLDTDIAPMTWYEQGTGAWRKGADWVGSDRAASSWRLSGNASNGTPGALTTSTAKDGTATVLPIPVAGLCTRSTNQWTAGILGSSPLPNPCLEDNRVNDLAGVAFDSAPVTKAVKFQGPINARLYVSTIGGNGMLSVAVEDVAPDGTVKRLTGGWQVISHRALDTRKSRYLDGKLIQAVPPIHQGGREAAGRRCSRADRRRGLPDRRLDPAGSPAADRRPGVRRAAPVADRAPAAGSLTAITLHNSAKYPSVLTIPKVSEEVEIGSRWPPARRPNDLDYRESSRSGLHRDALAPVAHEGDLGAIETDLGDQAAAQRLDHPGLPGDPGVGVLEVVAQGAGAQLLPRGPRRPRSSAGSPTRRCRDPRQVGERLELRGRRQTEVAAYLLDEPAAALAIVAREPSRLEPRRCRHVEDVAPTWAPPRTPRRCSPGPRPRGSGSGRVRRSRHRSGAGAGDRRGRTRCRRTR